jgi:hypothetical protein
MIWAAAISHEATSTTLLVIEYRGGPLDARHDVVRTLPPIVRIGAGAGPPGWVNHTYRPTGEVTARGQHIYQLDEVAE